MSKYHQTTIEKILNAHESDDQFTESDLRDPRVQIFLLLASNPDRAYTIDEIIHEINRVGLIKMPPKDKMNVFFNLLFIHDLATHDFETRTYKYNHSPKAVILMNNINIIRAL